MQPQTTAIKALFVYPVKSLGGVSVATLRFNSAGVVNDRRYMLVDGKNRMLTLRSHSQLSQFHLAQLEGGWQVSNHKGSGILIADNASTEVRRVVAVLALLDVRGARDVGVLCHRRSSQPSSGSRWGVDRTAFR